MSTSLNAHTHTPPTGDLRGDSAPPTTPLNKLTQGHEAAYGVKRNTGT